MRRREGRREDWITPPSDEDLQRIQAILRKVGGEHVDWGASSVLDVLVTEHRMYAERLASKRLIRATWALVLVTAVLVVATLSLVIVSL